MYICRDCGSIFEDPKKYIEKHGLDSSPYEEITCCPVCGGDYRETYECNSCGQYIFGEFVELENEKYYCSECFKLDDMRD